MLIYSIPYFVDFVIGIISTKWSILLIDGDNKNNDNNRRALHEEENELKRFSENL